MSKKILAVIFTASILLSSCASILNSKQQVVNVHTNNPNSKVYVNDDLQGTGETVETKLQRNANLQQIKITNEGFKDQYFITYQGKKSPLHILSWVPFGILIYPPMLDYGPKSFDYNKDIVFEGEPQKINKRLDEEKFVYIKSTSFEVEEDDFQVKRIKEKNYKKGKDKLKNIESNNEKLEVDNSIFSNTLGELLETYNYTDTTNTILKKKTNSLYVDASVTNIEFYDIYTRAAKRYHSYVVSNVTIKWDLLDIYSQPKYSTTLEGNSGEFSLRGEDREAILNSLDDAITSSFIKFINEPEFKENISKEESEIIDFDPIVLEKSKQPKGMEEAMQAVVTIKSGEGHGSGFLVSKDGYVLTNLHVVATADKLEVLTNDSKTFTATVVRKNEFKDLALLKIDGDFEYSFTIPSQKNYTLGQEIYAIGTPNSLQLGQTLSKGIISGERANDEDQYIQTDASVNSGNSGGPLVNENGELLGVVNSKLSGIGVEGIGFAIPGKEIENALMIK